MPELNEAENVNPPMLKIDNAREFMRMVKEYPQPDIIGESIMGICQQSLSQ